MAVAQTQHGKTVVIDGRFNGPPGRANGGYIAGLLSRAVDGPIEVTLRRPAPLGEPLTLEPKDGGAVLWYDYAAIAEAHPSDVDVEPPPPPDYEDAIAARSRYPGFASSHPFPLCFVCGPRREDGLGVFPGPVRGRQLYAAAWRPRGEFADERGFLLPEYVWGALDCPGGIIAMADEPKPMVLGRISGAVQAPVRAGDGYIVLAWRVAHEGRKHYVGTALFDEDRALVGSSTQTWLEI
jgi:hypothetical protein